MEGEHIIVHSHSGYFLRFSRSSRIHACENMCKYSILQHVGAGVFSSYSTRVATKSGGSLGARPSKDRKEGLAHRLGWKCTLRNVRNFINC